MPVIEVWHVYIGLIQNIWVHIWCLTSCGVRSASARAFNTCAREVREQRQARALRTRARVQISSHKLSERANKLSERAQCSRDSLAHLARASVFARASRVRAGLCSRTSRVHVLNACAHVLAWFQLEMFHRLQKMTMYTYNYTCVGWGSSTCRMLYSHIHSTLAAAKTSMWRFKGLLK